MIRLPAIRDGLAAADVSPDVVATNDVVVGSGVQSRRHLSDIATDDVSVGGCIASNQVMAGARKD